MISFQFNFKLTIKLVLSFMLFTVIGTLTHELGHIAVAKYFGKGIRLHYGSMSSYSKEKINDPKYNELRKIRNKNWKNIKNNKDFKEKKHFLVLREYLSKKYPHNKFHSKLIIVGGPVQTILTSFLGLLLLWFRKSKLKKEYQFLDWLGIFLSLFVLREVFNFVTGLCSSLIYSKSDFHGDEFVISRFLGFNEWIIPTITMLFGAIISLFVIFKILPIKYRLTFIVAGLIGGVVGFSIWFGGLGKLLIP